MDITVNRQGVYAVSPDVVARDIEGEIIIVPLIAGIGDLEDDLFALNETGKVIWDKLDGRRTLGDVISELSAEYQAVEGEIERDVLGLVQELVQRRILIAQESA
jgi:Coenzyme PQQ synthesis protein D (PqqD)